MNLSELTDAAAQMAEDPAKSRYSGLYTTALNLAQQQFVLDSKCLWKYASYTISANDASYVLPTDFLFEKTCVLNGLPLQPASRFELTRQNTGSRWDQLTGTPRCYIIDPEASKDELLLYPIPVDADAGKDLVLTYYAYPLDMVNPTDLPLNGNLLLAQFHVGIAAWAAWYLKQAESMTVEVQAKKKDLLQIYNDRVSQATDTFANTITEPLRMRGVRNYGN